MIIHALDEALTGRLEITLNGVIEEHDFQLIGAEKQTIPVKGEDFLISMANGAIMTELTHSGI